MRFISTRADSNAPSFSASDAILKGLAPDGGLFVPESFPRIPQGFTLAKGAWYAMYQSLLPYFEGDELEGELEDICRNAFDFPVPFHRNGGRDTLELYFGPTAAFKDFGARFLAFSMERLLAKRNEDLTILVATSGDTGGAVASAFHNRSHLSVKVLFPKGRVAERQRRQLTGWDGNVSSYEVEGSFDDCQRMVKEAFMDPELSGLSSANSINLGRLLPQMAYYVYASSMYRLIYGEDPVIVIPSGNVGNATGAYWAKEMGAPIRRIVLAANANRPITDYLETGKYEPRPSVMTLANAMDVGAPSNIERLFHLFPDISSFRASVSAASVSDEVIRATIKEVYEESGYVICPHTACGERVRRDLVSEPWSIVVSTAHPAKFNDTVESLIGRTVAIPESLYGIMQRPSVAKSIAADYHLLF